MRHFLLALLAFFLTTGAFANADSSSVATDTTKHYWKVKGNTSVGFSQMALSNWTAGGENSYALNAMLNFNATHSRNRHIWENNLLMEYGMQQTESQGVKKLNDQIIANSKYSYRASGNWYYTARGGIQTQFAKGYDYDKKPKKFTSEWFAPAYLLASAGMEYYNKSKTLTVIISPATAKWTFVNNSYLSSIGSFGVPAGDKSKLEFGAAIIAQYKKTDILKNVSLETNLSLFSNYKDKPQNIDVNWQVLLFLKVNKFLATSISTQLVYDDNVLGKVQFKEILAVGLSYSF